MKVEYYQPPDDSFKEVMDLQYDFYKKIRDEFNTNIKTHVKNSLKKMGLDFDFCKDRLHLTIQGDTHKIYLDDQYFVCGYIFKLNPVSEKDNTFSITTTTQFF